MLMCFEKTYSLTVCILQAKMPFDDNKLYCSEVLSILLQNHEGI